MGRCGEGNAGSTGENVYARFSCLLPHQAASVPCRATLCGSCKGPRWAVRRVSMGGLWWLYGNPCSRGRCKEYIGEVGIASGTGKPCHSRSAVTWGSAGNEKISKSLCPALQTAHSHCRGQDKTLQQYKILLQRGMTWSLSG